MVTDLAHLYAIADTHLSFGIEEGNKAMDLFGGPWVGHADRLKAAWLKLVEDQDSVIIAGDISWALKLEEAMADLAFLDSLPGRKILVRGNHDLWWSSMKKMRGLFKSISFIQNDSVELESCVVCGSRGWICPDEPDYSESEDGKIYRRELIRLEMALKSASECGKPIIAVTHYPPRNRFSEASGFSELLEKYGARTCVFGHLHGEQAFRNAPEGLIDGVYYRLVSLDRLSAVPLRIF